MAHALRDRGVDGVLAYVSLDSEVVDFGSFVFRQVSTLKLVFVRRVPSSQNHFTTATHGLGITAHHTNRAEIVQDVFGGDGLRADPGFGKSNVLGNVARQVMAYHQHVDVLVKRIAGVWTRRVGGTGKYVFVLDH